MGRPSTSRERRFSNNIGIAVVDSSSAASRGEGSLGAGPIRVLFRVRLPLLLPALGAAAGLAVALSMGELGATVMVYPATWKTLPVTIFALTDRGQAFQAVACTTILVLVTLLALVLLGRIRGRAALR